MKTMREVIAELEAYPDYVKDLPIAYSWWGRGDVELWLEDYDTDKPAGVVWAEIVDDFQEVLNSDYYTEKLNEELGGLLAERYGYRD